MDIPEEILELILMRIDSYFRLLDASSTCKQWRRVVADAEFLRRFRALHGPPIAGVYYQRSSWLNIDFVPSSAAIAPDRFSLDFLRSINVAPPAWRLRDSRGTLLLLDLVPEYESRASHRDMVVCEPVTQRYERIPARVVFAGYKSLIGYLLDGEVGGIGMSNFRVACLLRRPTGLYDAGVFTASGGSKRRRRLSWSKVNIGENNIEFNMGRTKDFAYWYAGERKVLSLDMSTAEFSSCVLPETDEWADYVLPETDEWADLGGEFLGVTTGRDGVDRIVLSGVGGTMKVFVKLQAGGGGGEWAVEKTIELSVATRRLPGFEPCYLSYDTAFVHVQDTQTPALITLILPKVGWTFHIDIETNEVEPASHFGGWAHPCELPWPPTFMASE